MAEELERGRECYRRLAWRDAYRALSAADSLGRLGAEDLEALAASAYLIGLDDEALGAFERAHHAWIDAADAARAARAAFWLGLQLLLRGDAGRARGWLARARRLLDRRGRECVEEGYLQLPDAEQHLAAGDPDAAYAAAARAAEIGERFGDRDVTANARHLQGRALVQQGKLDAGLALLDECMVGVTAGELSPLMTGLLYCSVIHECLRVYALDRAREWTTAMAAWCQRQPQLLAFTGTCLVHRSEVMLWCGEWGRAFDEARSACQRTVEHQPAAAFYQQGEVHRLRGALGAAEQAYARASRGGCDPQPGLALLRLAQGQTTAAVAAMHRAVRTTTDPLQRTRLLPAYVEILLAAGDVDGARVACRELEAIARPLGIDVLSALAAHARGALALAEGDPASAITSLRHAQRIFERVDAPYLVARARALIGVACRALGDEDGSALELDAARRLLGRLGAVTDPVRRPVGARALTARELQVLRLVAAGKTNKLIARALGVSERTVDRHVSNIFSKLDVSSRAAATAHAYERDLL